MVASTCPRSARVSTGKVGVRSAPRRVRRCYPVVVDRRRALLSLIGLAASSCDEPGPPPEGQASASSSALPEPEPFEFGRDLEAGVALARREKRRLILFFSAEWNGACKAQQKVFATPEFKKAAAGFVGVLVDVTDQDEPKAKKAVIDYRPAGVLAVLLFDSTGSEVQRVDSFEPLDDWLERLARVS